MPNVNLLPTINTATTNNSYFVVSDNGLVRRLKYTNLVDQIQQSIPDSGRTDQYLFTTTDVLFRSVSLYDRAEVITMHEHNHGFQSVSYGSDGTNLKQADYLGSLRFGGFDGTNNTLVDNGISSAGINAVAIESWAANGNVTTRSGTAMNFYIQPVNTRLAVDSRVQFISALTTTTGNSHPVIALRIGSVLPFSIAPNYHSTSSDGTTTYTSAGRADLIFSNSRIYHSGVAAEDTGPINVTVTGTNVYTFIGARRSNFAGAQLPLKSGDTLGGINFRGISTSSNTNGVLGAIIRTHATADFNSANPGTGMHFRNLSSSTGQLVTNLEIQPEGNYYNSSFHKFADATGDGTILTIESGTLVFSDNSVQSTAYPGFAQVPGWMGAAGTKGQMAYDNNYLYICVDTNSWKRIAASDF